MWRFGPLPRICAGIVRIGRKGSAGGAALNQQRPALIDAQQLPSVRSIPGAVVPLFENAARFEDVLAYHMGPCTSTEPFAVPAFRGHCIVMATQGSCAAE